MLNNENLGKLGRLVKNTYGIKATDDSNKTAYDDFAIGRTIMGMVLYLEKEQERDLREKANQAQWDGADENRIDVIGSNGNEGLHY